MVTGRIVHICQQASCHKYLDTNSFLPDEFKYVGSQSQFSMGTPYLAVQNGRQQKNT